jgi:hypothetical protein
MHNDRKEQSEVIDKNYQNKFFDKKNILSIIDVIFYQNRKKLWK